MPLPLPARTAFLAASAAALALAGCARETRQPEARGEADPLLASIIAEPIMTDRQLADQNQAASAVAAAGPAAIELPPQPVGPDAANTAKGEAATLAGGGVARAPAATAPLPLDAGLRGAVTAGQLAQASGLARPGCAAQITYGARWAAALPPALPVYPRGAVQEAAGTDAGGCALRAVTFLTPVSPDDVIGFYYTLARKAGAAPQHRRQDDSDVLEGANWLVHARPVAGGLSQVDLVVGAR
jgi:hypothetical protein